MRVPHVKFLEVPSQGILAGGWDEINLFVGESEDLTGK